MCSAIDRHQRLACKRQVGADRQPLPAARRHVVHRLVSVIDDRERPPDVLGFRRQQFGRRQRPIKLGQLRLEIEEFEVTGRPRHEEVNNTLGFGRVMRLLWRQGIQRCIRPSGSKTWILQ